MTALALGFAVGVCVGACATLLQRTLRASAIAAAWKDAWRAECNAHDATRARMQQRRGSRGGQHRAVERCAATGRDADADGGERAARDEILVELGGGTMADLTNAERETHLNMAADDRSAWTIGSDDPVMQRRFESVGATLISTRGEWREYTLPVNQISLRQPPKPMPEERKAELAMRLAALRNSPSGLGAKNRSEAADDEGVEE